ncbi:MAG: amidohydrolase family protein [Methanomassiliicoccales archaeon]|nr:amidohydrolase family protein [Methanomassiliicoccales archaeon]
MRCASGRILTHDGFVDGYVRFEGGKVIEVGEGKAKSAVAEGIITPTLVDAHTHLLDAIVPVDLTMSLEKLVAPPNGLKHTLLREADPQILTRSLIRLGNLMRSRGISSYIDFREGGKEGAHLLSDARGVPQAHVLGRPLGLDFKKAEVNAILSAGDGIGVSSISDWDYPTLHELAKHTRSMGKKFAIHASERVREDIGKILDLKPSFVVHMTTASEEDIEACVDAKVPIVVCPRSNLYFGRVPPIATMLEKGATIAIGTDNAMLGLPDMLVEMEFAARILRLQGVKDVRPVLDMATVNGRKLLNEKIPIGIESGKPCDFMVSRSWGGDPVVDLLLRGSSADPIMVCMGKWIRRGTI